MYIVFYAVAGPGHVAFCIVLYLYARLTKKVNSAACVPSSPTGKQCLNGLHIKKRIKVNLHWITVFHPPRVNALIKPVMTAVEQLTTTAYQLPLSHSSQPLQVLYSVHNQIPFAH